MPDGRTAAPTAHRVVVQVTDGGAEVAARTLRSLANLLTDLEADGAEVEVVAHAAGLDLLLPSDTASPGAITGLQARGVAFLACENTLRGLQVALADLVPGVRSVPSGVGHLVRRQTEGWSYLRG